MRLVAEAIRSAISQPVASIVAALIVAGACAAILSTTGQTVQAEQQVLAEIDAAGTRSIVIFDAVGDAGITAEAIERIGRLAGIEWAIGLGPATDVRAAGIPGGRPVAVRALYGNTPPQIHVRGRAPRAGEALVGPGAQQILGLQTPIGGAIGETDLALVGGFQAADPLGFLNRSLIRAPESKNTRLLSIHVLVSNSSQVDETAEAALLLLGADNPASVAVETSETLADIRAAVAGELGQFSRELVALVLIAGLILTALAVYGAITSRRKDLGRRRVLGASRSTITLLVMLQTGVSAAIGAIGGTITTGLIVTQTTGEPPDAQFAVAVATLAVLTAILAAVPPAIVAAYRDPIRVLRVP